ncbi:unnamed protein product [Blepharisma stoltei]|uniref:Kinesin-like protein n=1 Tax=Blepharisma stoltei TaxID=1481888 RepID=A0AAU9KA89_9CILI|nr:unnamed protein product [Blepharisma stoltei]
METSTDHIKVAVRVRPLLPIDKSQDIIVYTGNNSEIRISDGDHYLSSSYDKVFTAESSQDEIFDFVSPILERTIKGFNCTIFAYGQTGSGKTFTMFGADWEINNPAAQDYFERNSISRRRPSTGLEHPLDSPAKQGIIPKSIAMLFNKSEGKQLTYYSSFLQIYNEKIYDLLQDPNRSKALNIRESKIYGIFVEGLAEFVVESTEDCFMLLSKGDRNRAVRQTRFNHHSSRSHTIFQLLLESDKANKRGVLKRGKLNFCDLAGSEKYDKENAMVQDHIKELTQINKSLSTLGKVIYALGSGNTSHIPYRDSKLTRLLQDSLGVSTQTILIATVSPSAGYAEETISTLKFADRARKITIKIKKNEISATNDELILRLQREIQHLKSILNLKRKGGIQELQQEIWELKEENEKLKKLSANATIEEVERLKQENKRLKLSLQNNGFPSDLEGFYVEKNNFENQEKNNLENQEKTENRPPSSSGRSRKESNNISEYGFTNRSFSPSENRRRLCPRCNQPPPCIHVSSLSIEHSASTYRSTNSTDSRYSKNIKIPKNLQVRYRMTNCVIENGGISQEIKDQEARQKEMKKIKERLGKLAELESYRKAQFKMELERLEAEKRRNDEEIRRKQTEDAKRRKILKELKEKVSNYKESKKAEKEEEDKKLEDLKRMAERKRKKRNEDQKRKLQEFYERKKEAMLEELADYEKM